MTIPPLNATRPLVVLTVLWIVALLASGWRPFDRATWWMEVAPVLIALPVLWVTARRHPLTPLALALIGAHGMVLMLGGAYSYARVPAGFAVQEWLDLARNPYDRFGHFMQASCRRSCCASCCGGRAASAGGCWPGWSSPPA